jgi:DNA-directed RNA polymerase specialized sigma24 family protein
LPWVLADTRCPSALPTPAHTPIDRALTRLADGDSSAFDEVFGSLWPILRAYCLKALSNAADAEDAAQRALLKMFEAAPTYDRTRPAIGWALSFAFWECKTERTRRGRRKEDPEREHTTRVTPEALSAQKQQYEVFERVLSDLSEAERALVLKDVSPLLDTVNPAAQRKRRQRLLTRLRDAALALWDPKGAKP